jgi:S1-C subfamily serine protease
MINRSMVIAGMIGGLVSLAGYQVVSNTSQPSMAQSSTKTVPLSAPSIKALPQAATAVPQSAGQVQLTFAPIVRRVAPAVVNVYSRSVVRQQVNPIFSDPLFQQFFGVSPEMRQRVQQSLGSRHRRRAGHCGSAGRQARVQGPRSVVRCAHRSRGAEDRHARPAIGHYPIR